MAGKLASPNKSKGKRQTARRARSSAPAARTPRAPGGTLSRFALEAFGIYSATDAKGRITTVNDNFCAISGYRRDELLGQDHRLLQSGVHGDADFEAAYRTIAQGQPWRGELCNRARDGRLYWVDATIVPVVKRGRICGYESLSIVITERKQAEDALRRNEILLRSTLSALSEGVVVQDASGHIVSSNPAAERILNLSRDQLSGVTSFDPRWRAVREDGTDFPGEMHPAMRALATGEPQKQVTMGLRCDDGSTTWILINAQPMFTEGQDKATFVVTSFTDITSRILTQEVLNESISAIPDGFVAYDAADRLIMCNDAYKSLYSASAPAMVKGARFIDILRYGLENGQYPEAGTDKAGQDAWLGQRLARHRAASTDLTQQLDRGRWLQIRERRTPNGYSVGFRTDVSALMQETAKLRAVLDNFPGGITFFDQDLNLVASNERWRQMLDVPKHVLEEPTPNLASIVRALAHAGEYGPGDPETLAQARLDLARTPQRRHYERVRPDGTVLEMRAAPLPDGGFVTTYMDVTQRHAAEQRLTESEFNARRQTEKLEITLAHMSQGLSMFDPEGRLLVWNQRFVEIYAICPEIAKRGTSIRVLLAHMRSNGSLSGTGAGYFDNVHEKITFSKKLSANITLKNGRIIKVAVTAIKGGGWVATHEDVTERKQAEFLLREKNTQLAQINMRFEAALGNMTQGLCLFDAQKRLVIANRRFREIYALTEKQVEPGTHLAQILSYHSENGQTHEKTQEQLLEDMPKQPAETFTTADGRVISILRTPLADGGWLATHEDITERRRADEQISHLAYHDVLTGLANRAKFKREGEQALSAAASRQVQMNVLLVDLDRFKPVNDTLGHAAGDALLQMVAARMSQVVRHNDLVARLGGDEFAILQECDPSEQDAGSALAARIVGTVGAPFDIDGHEVMIGASVGVAMRSSETDTVEQLMHKADLALYSVKSTGRNGFKVYEDSFSSRAQEQRRLSSQLAEAAALGQLELHYQPVISLADDTICGMEALLRWRHPERGLMPPDDFIPLAEDSGLIVQLGDFVIRQACLDAADFPPHVKVAINISPNHLKRRNVFANTMRALLMAKIAPERLEIEVTETVLMQQDDGSLEELQELRRIGVSVALDDFGTGYSSLSHLRMFTFDKVKIDKSFIAGMTERSESAAIVAAITGLARNLNILTTGEGIETLEQLNMLKAAGCSLGQGYFIGEPMPAADARAFATRPMLQKTA